MRRSRHRGPAAGGRAGSAEGSRRWPRRCCYWPRRSPPHRSLVVVPADRLTDDAAQQQVVAAAKAGTEAILTYSPENLDADLAEARSHLTEPFLDYYRDFTERVVRPPPGTKGSRPRPTSRAPVSPRSGRRAEAGLRQSGHHQQGPANSRAGHQQRAGDSGQHRRPLADPSSCRSRSPHLGTYVPVPDAPVSATVVHRGLWWRGRMARTGKMSADFLTSRPSVPS